MINVHPQAEFLQMVVDALRRRARAINYIGGRIFVERIIEKSESVSIEKIEITYRRLSRARGPRVRIFIWSDRWCWVDAREIARQGWRWKWTAEGRLMPEVIGTSTIAALEESIKVAFHASEEAPQRLEEIWKPLLARGPIRVP